MKVNNDFCVENISVYVAIGPVPSSSSSATTAVSSAVSDVSVSYKTLVTVPSLVSVSSIVSDSMVITFYDKISPTIFNMKAKIPHNICKNYAI
jgi:hypothetical protein